MDSCKTKRAKLHTFSLQESRTREQLQTNQIKAKLKIVQVTECPTSGTHGLLGSKGLHSLTSPDLPLQHKLVCSGQLHPAAAAVLGGHPTVLASPICWGLHCNWTAPSPIASFGLFRTMTMTQDATPQPLSMTPLILFMQPNQVSHGSCLHINKFCYQLEMQSWPTLNHCFYVLTLRKYFPFVSQMVLQPQKTSIDCPSKAKVSLQ